MRVADEAWVGPGAVVATRTASGECRGQAMACQFAWQFVWEFRKWATFFCSWSDRKQPSTETKWCLPAAAASLRRRPGGRGHNLPRQAYTQTDLLRTIRAAQTLNCRELQNLEVPLGPKDRDGSHGCKCAQMKFFTHRIIELLNHWIIFNWVEYGLGWKGP